MRVFKKRSGKPSSDLILKESGDYRVYCVEAGDIPLTLRELGRLREATFRFEGEGSGKALDLDEFDPYYRHLFLWNTATSEIVGAYRFGLGDELMRIKGLKGLYTSTFFKYSKNMEQEFASGIELGRSFIQKKYQKNPIALGLLWKGVMTFVYRNPRYKKLFGAVSISNDYCSVSKQIIIEYLKNYHFDNDLAKEVKAKHQPKLKVKMFDKKYGSLIRTINEVDELVKEVEPHFENIPVLIRQYIRLNGKYFCFNYDYDFNSLDALILTDLTEESVVTSRYMGKKEYAEFLEYHKKIFEKLPFF